MKLKIIKPLIIKVTNHPSYIKLLNNVRTPRPSADITSLTIYKEQS